MNTREGIIRKPDDAIATIVDVPPDIVPKFDKISCLSAWLAEYFATQQFETIASTNAQVRFTKTSLSASTKRSREANHNEAYAKLNSIVRNAEYDHFEAKDERHQNLGGQDVYVAATRLDGKQLFSVVLKFDVPSDAEVATRKNLYPSENIENIRYKDHKLTEKEIAPVAENYGFEGHTATRAINDSYFRHFAGKYQAFSYP